MVIVDDYFEPVKLKKKAYCLEAGQHCEYINFVDSGCVRHYHINDGNEITCDFSVESDFFTDLSSFNTGNKSKLFFQAMENTKLLRISRPDLEKLYRENRKFEEIGRKITEEVAIRSTEIAMSLASDKPEVRYRNLMQSNPEIFLRVPQKYIATLIGLTPESLSRIRKRVINDSKS